MSAYRALSNGLILSILAAAAAACVGDDTAPQHGTLQAALVATGADGATYRLPSGTQLVVQRDGSDFPESIPLDGSADSFSVDLATGFYLTLLTHPSAYTSHWPLERTLDGKTTIVEARLDSPASQGVTVVAAEVVEVVWTFAVPEVGPVVFEQGSLRVAFDVESAPVAKMAGQVDANVQNVNTTVFPAAPAALVTALANGVGELSWQGRFELTGAWTQETTSRACAPVDLVLTTTAGTVTSGVSDLLDEIQGAGRLCVFTWGQVTITAERTGTATTPTYLGLGAYSLEFGLFVTGELPQAVFDGETLDLPALVGKNVLADAALFVHVIDRTTTEVHWFEGEYGPGAAGSIELTYSAVP